MAVTTFARPAVSTSRGLGFSFATMFSTWRQRRTLETLDSARLSDIGLSYAEARKEAARPLWDL